MPDPSRILQSDKYYRHRYTEIFDRVFAKISDCGVVVEIGVFNGDSMAWLAERFPHASLVGIDVLPVQPGWPMSPRISYVQADQANRAAISQMFDALPGPPDLVIEDGSHIPQHQATRLAEGFARLNQGGLYILEDICTSHPLTEAFAQHSVENSTQLPTVLHVLMAMQHLRETFATPDLATFAALAHPAFLTVADINLLWQYAGRIEILKHTKLPLRCYACGGSDFDYVAWTCPCGDLVYQPSNNMTALIWKVERQSVRSVRASPVHAEPVMVPSLTSNPRAALSACVISYNRVDTIETCLSALAFADEILVVDKSSTNGAASLAARYADRVLTVPWSPTVEETRGFAIAECQHDWILYLDDDECLSPEAVLFVDAELRNPRADIYRFPLRHYVLGRHDERAYYWPEAHVRMFRRGAVEMRAQVHSGFVALSQSIFDIPAESGVCIHHLSHADAAQWVEKTNRYTSHVNRARVDLADLRLFAFAHKAIDRWAVRTAAPDPEGYPEIVALLRAVYDIVDRVKIWEEAQGQDGAALFADKCAALQAAYRAQLAQLARKRIPNPSNKN